MLTRTRLGWSIDSATPARWAASAAAASDCMARMAPTGDGEVSATSCSEPPRIHSATTRPPDAGVDDVEHPGDAGLVDPAQPQGAGQDLLQDLVGQGAVGVDEGQRHLPVQRGVHRLPELQGRGAAVEDQQPVAAAGDTGAGNQVHDRLSVDSGPRSRGASNGIGPRAGSAARSPFSWSDGPRRRRLGSAVAGMSGWKSSATGRGSLSPDAEPDARRSPMGGRSPPVLSLSGRWLPAPEACAGSAPGPHLPPAGTNSSAQGT